MYQGLRKLAQVQKIGDAGGTQQTRTQNKTSYMPEPVNG
jgi:hypothetical protein